MAIARWAGVSLLLAGYSACGLSVARGQVAPPSLTPNEMTTYMFSDGTTEYRCGPGEVTCGIVGVKGGVEHGCLITNANGNGDFTAHPAVHPLSSATGTSSATVVHRWVWATHSDAVVKAICEAWTGADLGMTVEYFEVTVPDPAPQTPSASAPGVLGTVHYVGVGTAAVDLYYWYEESTSRPRQTWSCPNALLRELSTGTRASEVGAKTFSEFQALCATVTTPASVHGASLGDWAR